MPDNLRLLNPPPTPSLPGYSQVVEAQGSRTIYVAGQVALDARDVCTPIHRRTCEPRCSIPWVVPSIVMDIEALVRELGYTI